MGGHYEKGLFNQLMEVQARLEAMEAGHREDHQKIKRLTAEVTSLHRENEKLRGELTKVKEENKVLRVENEALRKENRLLRDDNERMKRILSNNSSNSSIPPSHDLQTKPANMYNSRQKTGKKAGGQPGHPGKHLSKAEVEKKIKEGVYEHRLEEIGTPGTDYVTRYRLDLEVQVIATEIRIYADENGKYPVPEQMKAEVFYGDSIKAIAGFLYSEGVVANDRICAFINSISGDKLHISTGSVYGFCRNLGNLCGQERPAIEEDLLNQKQVCTDATTVTTNGTQTYIRNFSTADSVLYVSSDKKNLESMEKMRLLNEFAGTLVHDHETALYHFGRGHGECNVHLERYLKKNTEETGNSWSRHMSGFLYGMNRGRKEAESRRETEFSAAQLSRYEARYDEILQEGRQEHKRTKGKLARKTEGALLNRLNKYKANYLLFLHDFEVPFSNNMSEKDLRPCKNREKMAGGFRKDKGREMYCNIMSFVQTAKRRGFNIFQSITARLQGIPVLTKAPRS